MDDTFLHAIGNSQGPFCQSTTDRLRLKNKEPPKAFVPPRQLFFLSPRWVLVKIYAESPGHIPPLEAYVRDHLLLHGGSKTRLDIL